MALSVAGAAGTAQTNSNYVNAVNKSNKDAFDMSQRARDAETARQKMMEAQGTAAFDTTAAGLTRENFDQDQTAASTDFVENLDALPSEITTDTRLAGQEGATVEVKDAIASRVNKEAAATRDRIKSFADLTSFGRASEGRGTDMNATGDMLTTLAGLRRGSLMAGNQEQSIQPTSVTQGSNAFADILSGVGSIAAFGGTPMFKGMFGPGMTRGVPLKFSPSVMPPTSAFR